MTYVSKHPDQWWGWIPQRTRNALKRHEGVHNLADFKAWLLRKGGRHGWRARTLVTQVPGIGRLGYIALVDLAPEMFQPADHEEVQQAHWLTVLNNQEGSEK